MRVKLYKNAAANYHRRCYRGAHPACGMLHRPEWEKMLKQVEGKWLEVETEHLFDDQFNTVPIPGVSENGLRLMIEDVEAIEDDVRIGMLKCSWCFNNQKEEGKCSKCGKTEYLKPMQPGKR